MSLYNLIFGTNPFSSVLLQMLGVTENEVPRYRDCYLSEDGSEIVIHTRTGGGNRAYYEHLDSCKRNYPEYFKGGEEDPSGPWNSDLRKIVGFKYDEDDDFDCTYADFYYEVPEPFRGQVDLLKNLGAADEIERLRADLAKLSDPAAVHINMLRGTIAKPSWEAIKHVYAAEAEAERAIVERALSFIDYVIDGYPRGDISHQDYRVGVYTAALDCQAAIAQQDRKPVAHPTDEHSSEGLAE